MEAASQGEYESALGPYQLLVEPAQERLQRAECLSEQIIKLCEGSTNAHSFHVSCCLVVQSLKEALVDDIRTVPAEMLEPLLERHAEFVRNCVCNILRQRTR